MSTLIGVGGECVVIRKEVELDSEDTAQKVKTVKEMALRLAFYENDEDKATILEGAIIEDETIYNSAVKEMKIAKIEGHPNIMKYYGNNFEVLNDKLIHITGLKISCILT